MSPNSSYIFILVDIDDGFVRSIPPMWVRVGVEESNRGYVLNLPRNRHLRRPLEAGAVEYCNVM